MSDKNILAYSNLVNFDKINSIKSKKNKSANQSANQSTNKLTSPSTNLPTNQKIQTKNWSINSYNISSSYTPLDSIYLNIISNKTFVNYDGFIRETDLESDLNLDKFYTLMVNCFDNANDANDADNEPNEPDESNKSNYSIQWDYQPSELTINFFAVFDGFFEINSSITLKEKILSSDKVLSITLNEMDSKYKNLIDDSNDRIADLENQSIVFASHPTEFGKTFECFPLDDTLDLTKCSGLQYHGNYLDFNKLKCLHEIIMYNNQFVYQRQLADWTNYDKLYIFCYINQSNGCNNFQNYLLNLFDTPQIYLTNVRVLTISYKDGTQLINKLRSLPNLYTLIFDQYGNNSFNPLELIKSFNKLGKLIFNNCLAIQSLDQIKNWCHTKCIKLEIK